MLAIIHDQLLRSYSVAVGLAIPGLASPVLFLIGGGMSKIERWVEAGDEGVGCRGLPEKLGKALRPCWPG